MLRLVLCASDSLLVQLCLVGRCHGLQLRKRYVATNRGTAPMHCRAQQGNYSERAAARIIRDVVRTVAQVRLRSQRDATHGWWLAWR